MPNFFLCLPLISPIIAIDPTIDMGKTLINVTGSMVNAIVVDKSLNKMDLDKFKDLSAGTKE